jgi:putative transposase
VIDSQSVKTTEAGGPRGFDAGKKVMGRKRHAMVDTDGRPLVLQCHAASVQDRDSAIPLLRASRASFPFVARAFADTAYNAERVEQATRIAIEIVRKPRDQKGFVVHPRRWVVTARTIVPSQASNGPKRSGAASYGTRDLSAARVA